MLDQLRSAIDSLEIGIDSASLLEALKLRDQLEARICEAVGEYEATDLWDVQGRTSMTGWLQHAARMTGGDAHRMVQTARRLRQFPVTNAAWEAGDLSGGQVATVLAGVRREHRELFAEQEVALVPKLAPLGVAETRRAMNHWSTYAEGMVDPDRADEPESYLRASRVLGDRVALDGDLDADTGELVLTALRVAETPDVPGHQRAATTRRADALADICRFFLDNQASRPGARHRPHVNVVVEAEDLYEARRASYVGGTRLSQSRATEILCDAVMHRLVIDPDGTILDYGRATRTISAAIGSALVVSDEGCRFPGCDRPAKWSEAHHVVWFSEGGTTELSNLVLLCSRHHPILHRPGWHAKLKPDGVFEVTDPWGFVDTTVPPRTLQLC